MKKHFAIQSRIVRTAKNETADAVATPSIDPTQINTLVKDQVKHAAIAVVAVIASATVMHIASEIVINAATQAITNKK
jgi:hypothetical protein